MDKLSLQPIEDALKDISYKLAAQVEFATGDEKVEYQCQLERLNAVTVLLKAALKRYTVGG